MSQMTCEYETISILNLMNFLYLLGLSPQNLVKNCQNIPIFYDWKSTSMKIWLKKTKYAYNEMSYLTSDN